MQQAAQRPYRRSHFFINRSFQLRYMFITLSILLVVMGASIASMYYGIWGSVLHELSDEGIRNKVIVANRIYEYEKARQEGALTDDSTQAMGLLKESRLLSQREREIFQEILNKTHRRLLLYFIPLLIFIGWGTIFLSHKIAGPLYRLDQCFKQLSKGDLTTRAYLRKHDEAIWLSKSFNQATEKLDHQVSLLKKTVKEVSPQIKQNPSKATLENTLAGFQTSSQ